MSLSKLQFGEKAQNDSTAHLVPGGTLVPVRVWLDIAPGYLLTATQSKSGATTYCRARYYVPQSGARKDAPMYDYIGMSGGKQYQGMSYADRGAERLDSILMSAFPEWRETAEWDAGFARIEAQPGLVHGLVAIARVQIDPGDGNWPPKNVVEKFLNRMDWGSDYDQWAEIVTRANRNHPLSPDFPAERMAEWEMRVEEYFRNRA